MRTIFVWMVHIDKNKILIENILLWRKLGNLFTLEEATVVDNLVTLEAATVLAIFFLQTMILLFY